MNHLYTLQDFWWWWWWC